VTFQDILTGVIIPAASSITGTALMVWLFKQWIAARLKAGIEHEYNRKLESHKAALKTEHELAILDIRTSVAREAAFYSSAHASFAEGQKASMERKLNATDRLWSCILKLRAVLPPVLGFMDILTVDEYKGAKDHPTFRALTKDLSVESITGFVSSDIEEVRPYIGEYMWSVFFCYQAILLRILFLLHLGRTDAEKMDWHKDSGTRQILEAVLTAEELTQFDGTTFGKISWIKQRLEWKILKSAQRIISGESFSAESLQEAKRIQEKVGNVSINAQRDDGLPKK
jgi:hypothetical protein